jgi:alginate O-acetyltransferase complex protein AlgI
MRREMWWRNLALALSMVVFGLWHKGTLLFLIWGCYHGVLLVSQRLLRQAERRFNVQLPQLWAPLSWLATAALISLGWIFFRANSMPQAHQMLAAVASPGSYASHHLSSSLYLLIAILSAGYAVVLLLSDALSLATTPTDPSRQPSGMLSLISRLRWFWLPAVYALALLVVLMITLTQQGGVGQMMYRSF